MSGRPAPRGLGLIGAGRFAGVIAGALAEVEGVRLVAVADADARRAQALAARHGAAVLHDWRDLLDDPAVSVLAVATPPATHADMVLAGLAAGRHVFCEKPLGVTVGEAARVRAAAAGRPALVVDHVLRYNPVLHALSRLARAGLVGEIQRFLFDNDADDEHLDPSHWFWDEQVSGGIAVEHGVHFFDACSALLGSLPEQVQAMTAGRPDGTVDTVVITARHPGGALATYAHGFSHARRCERQLMRVDYGFAEARVSGWIPLAAQVDLWTDDAGATRAERLPDEAAELLAVPGYRLTGREHVTVDVRHGAAAADARGRGVRRTVPHRAQVTIDLGGETAKAAVYAESVRAALRDLLACADQGTAPLSGACVGAGAVLVATAAREAARSGRTVSVPGSAEAAADSPLQAVPLGTRCPG